MSTQLWVELQKVEKELRDDDVWSKRPTPEHAIYLLLKLILEELRNGNSGSAARTYK